MDFEIEGLHTETGPGVLEAAIRVDDALKAADKAALFKTFTKILAQRRGWMATFMAKWSRDWPGQSGHLHTSLRDIKTGKGAFYDANGPHSMSETMRWFVGGQQQLMPETPRHGRLHGEQLHAPDPRLLGADRFRLGRGEPHHGAARHSRLREVAARGVPGRGRRHQPLHRARRRHRLRAMGHREPDRSGRADPGQCLCGRASEGAGAAALARARPQSGSRRSAAARELFGDTFVDHYAATREWEEREARKAITDWQLARYFEII